MVKCTWLNLFCVLSRCAKFVTLIFSQLLMLWAGPLSAQTEQTVVVLTESWDASSGYLYLLEQNENLWQIMEYWPVTLGSKGLGWGKGVHKWQDIGPVKREGDQKSPAGLFVIGKCLYGYAEAAPEGVGLPYTQLTEDWVAVDDPNSRYYNRVLDKSLISDPDWTSWEQMRRDDHLYQWLLILEHNFEEPEPGAGSCIFLHLWRKPGHPTAGCTAMSEENLLHLARWLSCEKETMLLQMPYSLYQEYRGELALPSLKFPPEEF